jgi:general stress protein 26
MYETPEEMLRLQSVLDASAASAGPHQRAIITEDRRVDAVTLRRKLRGMCLLVLTTVTADGRPLSGPVDGYFLHGCFWFSSGRDAVRMRHLARRPAVSATHLPSEEFAVTVHGTAEIFDVLDPARSELRKAMLDWYLPKQGSAFETWLVQENPLGARIVPDKMFTMQMTS